MSTFTLEEYENRYGNDETDETGISFFDGTKASDYYFDIFDADDSIECVFAAKVFHDEYNCLDEQPLSIDHLLPKYLCETNEGIYCQDEDYTKSVKEIKKDLIDRGFIEKKDMHL